MWQLILCVNLTRLLDGQITSKLLFLDVCVSVSVRDYHLISRLSNYPLLPMEQVLYILLWKDPEKNEKKLEEELICFLFSEEVYLLLPLDIRPDGSWMQGRNCLLFSLTCFCNSNQIVLPASLALHPKGDQGPTIERISKSTCACTFSTLHQFILKSMSCSLNSCRTGGYEPFYFSLASFYQESAL